MNEVGVYVLTFNRTQKLLVALQSIQNQIFKDFDIIISDNSTNDETEKALESILLCDKRIKYIRRGNICPSGIEHINHIIRNNEYKYFMMFHDDDEMLPNMVGDLYDAIKNDNKLSAVATNAYMVKNRRWKLFFGKSKDILLHNCREMALRYVNGRIAPFPSYMYSANHIKDLSLKKERGGKYSDTSFVISLLTKGKVLLLSFPRMLYYISDEQDSQVHDYKQYSSLLNHMLLYIDKKELIPLRIFNIYSEASSIMTNTGISYWRRKIFFSLLKYSPTNYFPKYVIQLLGYRKK